MNKICLFLILIALFNLNCTNVKVDVPSALEPQVDNDILKSDTQIPVIAWSGLPISLSTVVRFKELRDAGFTHHLQVYGTIEDMQKVLLAAQQADVKIFLNVIETTPRKDFYDQITKHPALEGYYIADEPLPEHFDKLAEIVKSVQAMDSEHWCYINLLPTYGMPYIKARDYQDYVDTFLRKVPVKILSYDHYPVVPDGLGGVSLRGDFYENLEIIRNSAMKTEKPFWAFVLSTSHSGYPVPTLAHLRYQIYSNLAYGAQGIQYFTYWTVTIPNMDFNTGPLDKHGNRTVVYDLAKVMNKELQMIAGVFMGSKVISVSHTGESIPKETKRYRAKGPLKILETTGPGAVVSELQKGDRRFMVVVNRSVEKQMTLIISPDHSRKIFEINKDATVFPISEKSNTYEIDPGDIKIFMWTES